MRNRKRVMMDIDIHHSIKRKFWQGVNKQEVAGYLSHLESSKIRLEEIDYDLGHAFNLKDEFIRSLKGELNREIAYAKFYLQYFKRQQEPDFKKWISRQQVKDHDWHDAGTHDEYTSTNGKVRFTIKIKDNTTSIRVSLHISNDSGISEHLLFTEDRYEKEITYTNLRKKESVYRQIEEYKIHAEQLFRTQYQYPRYCEEQKQFGYLQTLLHIAES